MGTASAPTSRFVVVIKVEVPATQLEIFRVIDQLILAGASVAHDSGSNRLEVLVTVEDRGLGQAAETAIWLVNSIALGEVVEIVARTEAEHARLHG